MRAERREKSIYIYKTYNGNEREYMGDKGIRNACFLLLFRYERIEFKENGGLYILCKNLHVINVYKGKILAGPQQLNLPPLFYIQRHFQKKNLLIISFLDTQMSFVKFLFDTF